jgi:broad specificity phosphatase PhoE
MQTNPTRLILVRHGEVDANRNYAYLGRRDDELNARGLDQAGSLAAALAEIHIDGVVSSPLQRAAVTAGAIAESIGLVVDTDRRLIELDFGSWEGRSRIEVVSGCEEDRLAVEQWEADPSAPTPGGESLLELQRRVVEFADEITRNREGSTVVVVSHMGPIKTLLCAALNVPLSSANRLFLDPATISVVDWSAPPVVRLVNSHAHMGFANARWMRSE